MKSLIDKEELYFLKISKKKLRKSNRNSLPDVKTLF